MVHRVVVIGGGFAGISAAVHLAESGCHVTLVEKRAFLGGRACSLRDHQTGEWIDNGQHALMACYHQTLDLLSLLGTREGVTFQPRLAVPYRGTDGSRDALNAWRLPGPLHLLGGMLLMKSLSWKDKLASMRFGIALQLFRIKPGSESIQQLCQRHKQPPSLIKQMWNPIALSALNVPLEFADAGLFQSVMTQAFMGKVADSPMGWATVPLQELHGDHVLRFLEQHHGNVRLKARVASLETRDDCIQSVVLADGETIECDACVSALPANALAKLVENSGLDSQIRVSDMGASPILSVYLWYDKSFSEEDFCCLQDAPFEWVFHRSNFMNDGQTSRYEICLVASGATDLQKMSREDLESLAVQTMKKTYPESESCQVVSVRVFWEARATFFASPQNELKRLSTRTKIPNLMLAGDWTSTGLPATIEGAVHSGISATQEIKDYLNISVQ